MRATVSLPPTCAGVFWVLLLCGFAQEKKASEPINGVQRGQALEMLKQTADTVRKQYYDPTYHGIDLDTRYKEAEGRIRQASTFSQTFGAIAAMVDSLNDSHTFFLPPS